MTDVRDLPAALARIERWALPVAILTLFAYPNPLVPAAFAIPIVSGGLRLTYGRLRVRAVPVDAFVVLLSLGTLLGLAVAHQQDAAMLRFTGVVGALATFYALRGYIQTEREVRQVGLAVLAATVLGIVAVLALLRGVLPDSPVTSALGPLLAPFSIFPGVSGDTLDVNARFTVHQYGLAHVLLVASAFAVAGIALSGRGSVTLVSLLALVVLMPLLLASQARGAFLALALASTVVAAYRTRLAWMIPPLAVGLLYVLLQRGTISRGVESEWLSQRLGYWTGTLSLLGDVPLTGAGLGMRTFAEVFAWYHQLPDPYQVSHTHNVVVQAYAEQGLLGAIGMLGLLVVGIVVSFRALTRATGPSRWLVGGAASGFLGSAVYGMTDQVPSNNLSLALVLAMLALTVSADRIWAPNVDKTRARAAASAPRRPALVGTARRRAALMAALAIVALVGLGALSPRWISGLYLNAGSSQLLAAVLDRSRDPDLRAARLQRAEDWLAQAVSWNARNVPAARNLAWAKVLRHDIAGATATIQDSYRPDLTSFERSQLARVAADAGMVELTIQLYKEGGDETRLKALAEKLWSGRRYHDAALAYAGLTELDPDEAEYVSNFAKVILEGGGDDKEAANALIVAVRRKPESARNLARQLVLSGEPFRGNEKRQGGNFAAAKFWFTLASQVDPTYDRPEVELGSIHYYRELYQEAAEHFHEAQRRDPRNPSTFNQLGETYFKLGKIDEGLGYYQQGMALRPERADLHLNLARAYLTAGRREDAAREFQATIDRASVGSEVDVAARNELRRMQAGG
ncbi:MAG: tetratricopeptide repeat protein [Chloroflexota bacterium]